MKIKYSRKFEFKGIYNRFQFSEDNKTWICIRFDGDNRSCFIDLDFVETESLDIRQISIKC